MDDFKFFHRDHTGKIHTGQGVQRAFFKVANDFDNIARSIREEDQYADHVTEEQKDAALQKGLSTGTEIRAGKVTSFTVWQRINREITGEDVALLP